MIYNAADIARAWLAVAAAFGKDDYYPALSRTVLLEEHPQGLRLTATDSYMLLTSFVPSAEHGPEHEPDLDEAPRVTAIAMDLDGRGVSLMKYAIKRAKAAAKAQQDDPEIRIRLNDRTPHPDGPPQLEGMAGRSVVLEMPDVERVVLPEFDGDYPSYRQLFHTLVSVPTERVVLHPDRVGRLAAAAELVGGHIGWTFGGDAAPARVDILNAEPGLRGMVQSQRWDWYRNVPRVDNPEAPPTDDDSEVDYETADGTPATAAEILQDGAGVTTGSFGTAAVTVHRDADGDDPAA